MKKNVFWTVIVGLVLVSGLFVGCPPEENDPPQKFIAEQYRGTFETEKDIYNNFYRIILTENTFQFLSERGVITNNTTAYTEGNKLFFDLGGNTGVREVFTFTDNDSFYFYFSEKQLFFKRVINS